MHYKILGIIPVIKIYQMDLIKTCETSKTSETGYHVDVSKILLFFPFIRTHCSNCISIQDKLIIIISYDTDSIVLWESAQPYAKI